MRRVSSLLGRGQLPASLARQQQRLPAAPISSARSFFATYAENPARWQADPVVQMYGQMLGLKDTQHESFLLAATTLRAQSNLPRDLRASVARVHASVLFQQAAKQFEELKIGWDTPWPQEEFDKTLEAATSACDVYGEAVSESADPKLCEEVAPHCPEWPAAVAATRSAALEVRKLRAELRMREVYWHRRQAERARAIVEAARSGQGTEAGMKAADELDAAGLDRAVEDEELWAKVVKAAETLIEECEQSDFLQESGDAASELRRLRSQGQVALILALKDFAVSAATAYKRGESVQHILHALQVRPEQADMLSQEAVEQVRAVTEGVLTLCNRHMAVADTKAEAAETAEQMAEISKAVASFNAWVDAR